MHRSTTGVRRACAVGTTIALIGLTTGLGVFGATAAYAVDSTDTTTTTAPASAPATSGTTASDTTTGAASGGTTGSDSSSSAGTTPSDTTTADTTGSAATPTSGPATSSDTAAPTPAAGTPAAGTPAPTSTTSQPDTTAVTPQAAPAPVAATIKGDAKVGVTLEASADQLTGPYAYAWTVEGDPTVSTLTSFPVTEASVGKTITVTITGTDGTATATTAAVTEDVAFPTETTDTAPRVITVAAGTTVDEGLGVAKGSGTVEYTLSYADTDGLDPDVETPESFLPPEGTFHPATATLTGTLTTAGVYDFTVLASNGTSEATEWVEVVVTPGQAVGILASATDRSAADLFTAGGAATAWIIEPDGHITTITIPAGRLDDPTITDGGQPTVAQGGSLWVDGAPVDQYGNDATVFDDEGDIPLPTVTSDHATDQITFDEDSFATKVTFPHASTHVLTVAEDGLSVAFPVTVVPTVATVAAVTPKGQLAFTGSDATDALPWGLAMLAAGAGLIGFRAARRRTQR